LVWGIQNAHVGAEITCGTFPSDDPEQMLLAWPIPLHTLHCRRTVLVRSVAYDISNRKELV
jgi:hypothetical protein